MALVEKKIKANQTKTVTEPEKGEERQPATSNVVDLMDLLRKSIDSKKTGGSKPEKTETKTSSKKRTSTASSKRSKSAKSTDKEHRAA